MSTENTTRKMIKKLLSDCDITLKEVVTEMNKRHPEDPTTPQNITNKLARQTIKFKEVMEIADIVGYEVKFVKAQKPLVRKYNSLFLGDTAIIGKYADAALIWLETSRSDFQTEVDEIMFLKDAAEKFDVSIAAKSNKIRIVNKESDIQLLKDTFK